MGRGNRERMTEPDVLDHREIVLEEGREQPALHDVAGIGRAPLLGVLEALAHVLGEQVPLVELPDAPGVETLLLEEVPTLRVRQRRGSSPAVGSPAHEGQCPDALTADQHLAELAADT